MKKEYINPEMEVVNIQIRQQMLAGSPEVDEEEEYKEGDPVLSTGFFDNGGSEEW